MDLVNKNNTTRNIFIFLFSIMSVIDSINGYLIIKKGNDSNVGVMYRITIIIFLLFILVTKEELIKNIRLYIFFLYFLFDVILLKNNSTTIIANLQYVMKLFLPIIIIEAYRVLNKNKIVSKKDIDIILKCSCILVPLSLILSKISGISKTTYYDMGFKGFFNSTNELSIILLLLFIYSFHNVLYGKDKKTSLIFLFTILFSIILTGTKTSFVGVGAVVAVYVLFGKFRHKTLVLLFIIMSGVVVYFVLSGYLLDHVIGVQSRQNYLYNLYGGDYISYILSGRDIYLRAAINDLNYSADRSILFIFGGGPYDFMNQLGTALNYNMPKEIEMDLFDTFFYFGIIGVIGIVVYLYNIVRKAFENCKRDNFYYVTGTVICILFSILAGHILYGAMGGTFFALYVCGTIDEK